MKMSDRTLKILRNFTTINRSFTFSPGNLIYSSMGDSVFAWASVDETFSVDAHIYDLAQFVSLLDRFKDLDIEFLDKQVVVTSGKSRIKYTYMNSAAMAGANFRKLPISSDSLPPGCVPVGEISKFDVEDIKKISSTIGADVLQVVSDKGKLLLRSIKSGYDGNTFEVGLTKSTHPDFVASIDITKFTVMSDDYLIYVIPSKAVVLEAKNIKIRYLFTVESSKSDFGGLK